MNRMTLMEYIECQNIKRKIRSKTKSKNKQKSKNRQKSPVVSSAQTYSTSPNNNICPKQNVLSKQVIQSAQRSGGQSTYSQKSVLELDSKLSILSQSIQIDSFVTMNQKIEQIKQYVRQKIENDKFFATVSKMLSELENVLRLQIMKTYRLQLYKFQFENQKIMNQEMRLVLTQLNNKYIDSQIKYKRSLQKGKSQLNKQQKLIIQKIHNIGQQHVQKVYPLKKNTQNDQLCNKQSQLLKNTDSNLKQLKLVPEKQKSSFFQSLIAKGQQISNLNIKKSNQQNLQNKKIVIKPQSQKQRKVKWTQAKQQIKKQYPMPSFINRNSIKQEPQNIHDQSQIYIKQQFSRQEDSLQGVKVKNGKDSIQINLPIDLTHFLKHTESQQAQTPAFKKHLNLQKQKKEQIKLSIKQSKDYLKIERQPNKDNPKSKPKRQI